VQVRGPDPDFWSGSFSVSVHSSSSSWGWLVAAPWPSAFRRPRIGEPTGTYWAYLPNPLPTVRNLSPSATAAAATAAMAIARLDEAVAQLPRPEISARLSAPRIARSAMPASSHCPAGDHLVLGVAAWEEWVNQKSDLLIVAKMAIGHYQFETRHPFEDGTGGLGRLISLLQIMQAGELRRSRGRGRTASEVALTPSRLQQSGAGSCGQRSASQPLPTPFIVLAADNPIEYGGTHAALMRRCLHSYLCYTS
jgi:Fic/DOC family